MARLHSPHACRRLYNARNCITASPSGHNGKFIMMISTTTIISRTHTKSGHQIRSATPKMHPQAPHPNNAKAWFTPAYIARKPGRCGHCDFGTTPGSICDQPWSKERARAGLGRQKTDPQDPVPKNNCKVDDEAQGRTARDTARLRACPLIQWFRAMLQGAQNRPYLMLCGSAEIYVALLPSNSGHRKTCHEKQLNRFFLVQIDMVQLIHLS